MCDLAGSFFLVLKLITFSQSEKTSKKAVLWQGNRTYDDVVKFAT